MARRSPPSSTATPQDIDFDAIKKALDRADFNSRFAHQTERGAALSAAAQLDAALYAALRAWLVDDEKVAESMFKEMQPLGSLGSRIRMGYLLGMYGSMPYKNMITINRIRNEFAHKHEAKDFDYPRIQGLTNSLDILDFMASVVGPDGKRFDLNTLSQGGDVTRPYWRFVLSVYFLASIVGVAKSHPPKRLPPPV